MNTPHKKVPTDWENELNDLRRVRRFKPVLEHYPKRATLFWRLYGGKTTPRGCIKAFCLECNGWEEAAIREGTATACPLWRLRPYQAKSWKPEVAS
jgi:hypothetical protein